MPGEVTPAVTAPARRGMTIGTLARAAGVGVETIRFYERLGLVRRPAASGGYRRYADADLVRLRYIRAAKDLDLSLREIAGLEPHLDAGPGFCAALRAAVTARAAALDAEIADLTRRRAGLDAFLTACSRRPAGIPCPVVVDLTGRTAGFATG